MQENVSLRQFNTFGLESRAQFFEEAESTEALTDIIKNPALKEIPKFILGGGSNVLFTQNINALVIKIAIKGIELIKEDQDYVWLHVGAGEKWHDFVMYCVDHNYAGVENLSLIPGTIGAAPMQNIGAYGVEIKDVVETVEAISIETAEMRTFSKEECLFGYRESIFKHALKGKLIITGVVFRLNKKPVYHVEYGDIQKTLAEMNVETPTIKAISEAVIRIRESKLPDPAKIGNAGSFFKNPEISTSQFDRLKSDFPNLPGYPTTPGFIKVPAGWLIEQAGWKGYREGEIGVHARQALVLVNYGGGSGAEIKALSEKIQKSVQDKFGVSLSAEVNFV
ncbi:UDP-N-acetylmuramate dehydrogenase [Dyadobacter subterraneus]|uniref:UDP-N-acetylenolpyruvoylglucosamine reductase n=1 Tax=Dyadobacter subterraneus TaxID=2773304 RepID=A0ABR9WKR1_9BACT|nr:UDP-N-acetylmuramate dehydrogenase [Dyadobacter subterraneus]MBE9466072.1 UDP-N-acetylmuramate dehydrogenase [Dyadobacter subterraneus]